MKISWQSLQMVRLIMWQLMIKDIEEMYQYIEENKMNTTKDEIHFLPFWENGVKDFLR